MSTPATIATVPSLASPTRTDTDREQVVRRQQIDRLQQRLTTVRRRLDQAYLDKLDGRIPPPAPYPSNRCFLFVSAFLGIRELAD